MKLTVFTLSSECQLLIAHAEDASFVMDQCTSSFQSTLNSAVMQLWPPCGIHDMVSPPYILSLSLPTFDSIIAMYVTFTADQK